ncbi:MAG: ATP-dependent DNA helicase RecG, partial [Thermodesulfobacteriota bacterium]
YFEITIEDGVGRLSVLWFNFPAHLRTTLKKGRPVQLFGRIGTYQDRLQMIHPETLSFEEVPDPLPEVRPVYPEMDDVRPGVLRRIMAQVARELAVLPALFPQAWLAGHDLPDPLAALTTLHQPPADRPGPLPRPEDSKAWRALALFELLFLQILLARSRARQALEPGLAFPEKSRLARAFLDGLPFRLTSGQERALGEILGDMAAPRPMSRLLQGEVGSGKTVVALAAAFTAVDGGRQAAIMAPTELLARQHHETLAPHAERLGVRADLLVAGLPEVEKEARRRRLASEETQIVVGTHALISPSVSFKTLGLAVIDEQHRFGVAQRLALRSKSEHPDILVMTATPIPRSLALTLYGDLDVSTIRELPPGRRPVRTSVFGPADRARAYRLLAEETAAGGQAYIVAPRIEAREGEEDQAKDMASVESLYGYVRNEVLPGYEVGLVHGRLRPEEQRRVVEDFQAGRTRALVATTVIEVGVDVPGASVILVEGAERFGLAQLHQLRGRVGRGERPAQCLLVAGPGEVPARLKVMARTHDGFRLAEEDLKVRGPGDPAGVRQSGLPPLTWARLPRDLPLLLQARDLAREIVERDPELAEPSFKLVREVVDRLDERLQAQAVEAG